MIATLQGVVKNIEPRKVKAGTPDERHVYDVVDGEGVKWTVWEKALAESAWSLKDQQSVWKVQVEQNGKYTNRTLKDIQPMTGAGIDGMMQTVDQSIGNGSSLPSFVDHDAVATFVNQAESKDASICRQCAGKVAATMGASTPSEFWENMLLLAHYFETGTPPHGVRVGSATTAVPVQGDGADPFPSESPPPLTDDDLPF